MKPSGVGGQAVIEGVMMRNKEDYAIAVRKPDNSIVVEKEQFVSKSEKYKLFKLPFLRGILSFVESLVMGVKVLTYSASFYEEEEEQPSKAEKAFLNVFKEKAESVAMGLTVTASIILAVSIFILLPYFLSELIGRNIESITALTIIEGGLRIIIFVLYIYFISKMEDIRRLFAYHGAEHKTINCIEHGFPLNVENVRVQSREHKRCGTSFTFIVMFISIIFFMFIRVETVWLRVLIRLFLVPIISGVSYEFLKWTGRNDSIIVRALSKPGLLLQRYTTREPDDDMIEVAIASVEEVFDWKAFISEEKTNDEEGIEIIDITNQLSPNLRSSTELKDNTANERKEEKNRYDSVGLTNRYDKEDEVLQAVERIVRES